MRDIKYSTKNEEKLIKSWQTGIKAYPNGWVGNQTLSDNLIMLANAGICDYSAFPLTLKIYGMPTIIAKDLITFNPKGTLANYANSMLGSFTYPRATTPCSILVNNGEVIFDQACRAWAGYPEAVIYRLKNGTFGHGEFKYAKDLPKDVDWAIGGFGLMDMWNASGQGFRTIRGSDFYNTVVYQTNHNVLGIKNGMVYGVYYKNMTGSQINTHCKDKMQFDFAILLDGGGLASMNGGESFAKIKTGIKCGYAIQFI